jgi:hypothetical protein
MDDRRRRCDGGGRRPQRVARSFGALIGVVH